jgi:hypothetical protein
METAIATVSEDQTLGTSILEVIARAAADPKVDVEKMQKLLEMQERVLIHRAKSDFSIAMRDCQSEMKPVVRDAENLHTKSKYARLEKIDAGIRPVYTRHGFSLSYNSPQCDAGRVKVTCTVRHDAGHSETYELTGALDTAGSQGKSNKTDIQGLGSSVSYMRRYLACMIFNVVLTNEDDDGQALGFINEKQEMTILDLISEIGLDAEGKAGFLKYMGVSSINNILDRDYGRAMGALQVKLRQKTGGRA